MLNLKVGVLGTGDVGRTLGNGFFLLGCQVRMGARAANNEKAAAWASGKGLGASIGTFTETAQFADVLVLATRWSGTANALTLAGREHFAGKLVLDATNPLDVGSGGLPTLALGHTDSGGEQVQRWLPAAHVVKVFNTVGHAHMLNPQFSGGPPDMPICGNDDAAKERVTRICEDLGWEVLDLGGIEASRLLEPLALLWVHYGARTGSWNHAFKFLRP